MSLDYSLKPNKVIKAQTSLINSFISGDSNIDWQTVNSFGEEWARFSQFEESELQSIGNQYFDIVTEKELNKSSYVLDVGCGTGRWTKYVADKVQFVEAVDPSNAVFQAAALLSDNKNVRITQASVDNIPFPDNSFDFVFSLGVLHHIPDTRLALKKCVEKVKPGGSMLIYLYYSLDNRSWPFKLIFNLSNLLRAVISRMPQALKNFSCDLCAIFLYMPFVVLSRVLYKIPLLNKLVSYIPLSYYRDRSFYIIRNDALDRFGTPLEQRFSKMEIISMMQQVGLTDIRVSDNEPYWHAIGKKI